MLDYLPPELLYQVTYFLKKKDNVQDILLANTKVGAFMLLCLH